MSWAAALPILGAVAGPILGSMDARNQRKQQAANNAANRAHQDKINAENRAEAERIRLINAKRQDSQIQRQVADGRLAGLSPLAAMGNAGYSPAVASVAQSSPSQFTPIRGSTGAGLAGNVINSLLEQQGMETQILESRSRTLLNEANARKINGTPDGLPMTSSDGRRIENSTILVRKNNGTLVEMPNNELIEGLTPKELATWNALMGISTGLGPRQQQAGSNIIKESSLPNRIKSKFKYLERSAKARQLRLKHKLGR